ncbi:MAG: acyl-CoA dehydrogenase [Alphaproteobacteria bacterium]
MTFASPVKQMIFALKEMANYSDIIESELWPDLDDNFIETLLNEAAKLADNSIAPLNQSADKAGSILNNGNVYTAPGFKEAYKELVNSSWGTLSGLKDYGGQGLPKTIAVMIQELWNTSCMSFSLCPMLTQGAVEAISHHGTDNQKKEYLPRLLTGEWSGTMNLTEPQAGSDVGALKTSAKKNSDGSYSIKGTKIYITYGDHDMAENIIHLVLARMEGAPEGNNGISLFIVPKFIKNQKSKELEKNDLQCIGLEDKLGIHASPTCVMSFGENIGAKGFLLGEENRGLACMFTMMNNARLNVGMQGVGIAERSLQQSLEYSKERKQGRHYNGKSKNSVNIIEHPDVLRTLIKMESLTQASRAICYDNAIAIDLAQNHKDEKIREKYQLKADLLTPISKSWATDIGVEVASLGIQVHGGMGFIEDTGVAQYYRDSRIAPIYEGTNGIQAIDLVTRKLKISDGLAIKNFLDEIKETSKKCSEKNDNDFIKIANNLNAAVKEIEICTEKLLEWTKENKLRSVLFSASDYLELFGITAGSHYLSRGALSEKNTNSKSLSARKDLALFFSTQILVNSKALSSSICSNSHNLENFLEDF